ncbi:TIGR03619 family F420-dependent LLM class oxidoreductase [Phytohabitans sp. ZYX-F-186]|uniref:TIGR03619 family F420-dependent LLM class oxidoreductase n=1 Tax=Phytohabitans maris TaxID=3071409 RepID=A0ABU0ZE60_9ACTN|nr:TIGR03619 family F420-dependent LLM class oxidoreductase [Phytohabitans sp. ZYX-F-186]MDQ7905243.1 TIGR03619 family F420-dependent LLM class oxidoreductase [Phytohabitans sp. ZYX-F-186]
MKIGAQLAVTTRTIDAVTLARELEARGFESYWAPEHTVVPKHPGIPFPMTGGEIPDVYHQMADPFVVLSMMAAVTSRLRVATGVCLVPEHPPLTLAKAVSTLDAFSAGRFLFGLGTGWLREVTELHNPAAAKPWAYTIQAVAAMKGLWANESAAYDGDLVSFPEMVCDPRPLQRPHPPVIVGAQPTPVAASRIAAWADGWLATGVTPAQVAGFRAALDAECARIGRDPGEVSITVGVRDPSEEIREAYAAAGVERLMVLLYNHPGTRIPLEDWAAVGVATLSAPPPTPDQTLHALDAVAAMAGL